MKNEHGKDLDLNKPYTIQKANFMADVAQLVEPLVVVQVVAGSSPVVRPISYPLRAVLLYLNFWLMIGHGRIK